MDLTAERIESLKAGIVGALVATIGFLLITIAHQLVQEQFLFELDGWVSQFDLKTVIRAAIGLFTGFLFGVTYRYIIRQDANPQLKAGGVMAFGLVRGLAQIEVQLDPARIVDLAALLAENLLLFAFIALVMSWAIDRGWIKAFSSF